MKSVKLFLMAFAIIVSYTIMAQGVAINSDGSSADDSAMLDVKSSDMGLLIPRMTEAERDNIDTPATGLMIFQTDQTAGFYYYDGTAWKAVGASATGGGATTYTVGDFAQGGIVFWVDETGEHGLVCAKSNQDEGGGIRWYAGTLGVTRATGDGPFSGELNTSIIISSQVSIGDDGSDYAAQICNELQITEGGKTYGNWYLPSLKELNLMYANKATINATATANGGSGFAISYWSSTEHNGNYAWAMDFELGPGSYYKNYTFNVRAVRAF